MVPSFTLIESPATITPSGRCSFPPLRYVTEKMVSLPSGGVSNASAITSSKVISFEDHCLGRPFTIIATDLSGPAFCDP